MQQEKRGKSGMPLPAADEGMPLFPQPQGLRGSANADPQTLTRQSGKSAQVPSPSSLRSATSPKGRGKKLRKESGMVIQERIDLLQSLNNSDRIIVE